MVLQQILSRYNLKTSFAKLVKVLVLEHFYGTPSRVHFSVSGLVFVLEVLCVTRTRTRKLSTRLHHCLVAVVIRETNALPNLLIKSVGYAVSCSKFTVAVAYELTSLVSSTDIQEIVFLAQFY